MLQTIKSNKGYTNTMLPKLIDRQTTLPKMVAYV